MSDEEQAPFQEIDPFQVHIHPLCHRAAKELMEYLNRRRDWSEEFGLTNDSISGDRAKMFGVMVLKNQAGELSYIAAFSGKLMDQNAHKGFVPPVYDSLIPGEFLNLGMNELEELSHEIKALEKKGGSPALAQLKMKRKQRSNQLQDLLFDQYRFMNRKGEEKALKAIFKDHRQQYPPSAAGECAAPKLFQYAHSSGLTPLAMAEFWWGRTARSPSFKHGCFYPACEEKCRPILEFMLKE